MSPSRPRVAIVTFGADRFDQAEIRGALDDAGEPLLVEALEQRSAAVRTVAWDDPAVDWSAFDVAVIRSTWDYTDRVEQFVAWAGATAEVTALHNPAPVVRANVHKGYLLDLAAAGVPVIPTLLIDRSGSERGQPPDGGVVVKPAVGAGARGASTHDSRAAAADAVAELARAGDVLVQPFVESIATSGEVSLMVVEGQVTHAVRKRPAPGDYRIQPHYGGTVAIHEPTPAERAVADAALAAVGPTLLLARVDLVDVAGAPHLMELELVEPSLFLTHHPPAAGRLAEAILRRVAAR